MARTKAAQVDKNFIGGLITDYTALNFPENACTYTINTVYEPSGRVRRRYGFDYEINFEYKNIDRTGATISTYLWKEVEGNGLINLFVAQVGNLLHFYTTTADSISNGALVSTVNLNTFIASGADTITDQACQFTHGKGVLFVTHPQCDPFYVSYTNSVIAATRITVKIRDLAGVDDGLAVDARPTATVAGLAAAHKYNLFNQGWYFNSNAALTAWDAARSDMPSNADVWWYFKGTDDTFDTATIANRDRGNTPAPKGHYVVDAFYIDRTTVSSISGLDVETVNPARPKTCAFFAGRVWYAGVDSSNTINKLYFSQVVESRSQFGRCYQVNDPTAETLFDLLPTDGGTIDISGAGTIYKLFVMGNSLLVFASNGIWAVAGSQGIGFVANDFSVVKISAIEINSATNFVNVEGAPYWITGDAVCTVVTQDNLTFQIVKVSDNKIQRYLLGIPEICKQRAVGSFNPYDRTIQWLYRSEETSTQEEHIVFDRILVFNLLTQAFYIHTINLDHPIKVHSIELFKGFAGESEIVNIQANGDQVTSGGDDVIIFNVQDNTSVPVFKYFVSYYDEALGTYRFTFAEMNNANYVDWVQFDGLYYTSEFITGYKIHTNGQRFFQPNYIFVFIEEDEQESSAYVQGVFDYALTGDTGKWSSAQQVYNTNLTGRGINFRRLKIRGKGRALQLRFTSEDERPFTIIGWSIAETANNDL